MTREIRYNPFWGRSVIIASDRENRPWEGEVDTISPEEKTDYDPECYLCPGNRRANGDINPDYKGVWSFENDFPSLTMDADLNEEISGYGRVRPARGINEVLIYSPHHSKRLSTMNPLEVRPVIEAWINTYRRLGAVSEIEYVLIFENRGSVMGNSQLHPHGQVFAYTEIPDLIVKPQLIEFNKHRESNGGCFVCDILEKEINLQSRILSSNSGFTAFIPYAAMLPFDVIISPLRHIGSIEELDHNEINSLSEILCQVLSGLDRLYGSPYHYSMAMIQAPTDGVDYGFHMQLHITSLLRDAGIRKHLVGADIFGMIINSVDPDRAAEVLREKIKSM